LANIAIRCCFVETELRHCVPMAFPFNEPVSQQPLGSSGSLGSVPRLHGYYWLLRIPAVHLAALRLLRLAIPPRAVCSLPWGSAPLQRAWVRFTWSPSPPRCRRKRQGLPGSWGTPLCTCPALRPRRNPAVRPFRLSGAAFHALKGVGFRNHKVSGLHHTACELPVYASQPGSPRNHARLSSGCWPALPGGVACPLGPNARFQFDYVILPPRPGLAWRTQRL
jgi:hypothetical protein